MEADPEIICGIVGNIGQFWLKEKFIDLQINIDDHQFRCHRFILCACSEFFQVLLQSEMKDEVEHPVKEVTVRGVSPAMFQLALNAIYKGENGLATENMMEFWHAAHELQIPVLVAKCETFISCHMTRDNILAIYTRALLLGSDKIIKMVHEFMAENFEYFSKCQIFMLLSAKTLHEILCSRKLKTSQNYLVDFILKWVNHEPYENSMDRSCEDETREVQDMNIVSDQRVDHSSSGIGDKTGHVEVILQKPPVTSEDSCLQTVAQLLKETPAARKESLGKLLKLVRLSEASKDSLDMLADSDMIMGVKETRDIIRQALETRSQAQESLKHVVLATSSDSLADVLAKTEQVVVFGQRHKIYAYSLDRSRFFCYKSFSTLVRVCAFNNSVCATKELESKMEVHTYQFENSAENEKVFYDVGLSSAVIGDFCYTFRDDGLYRAHYSSRTYHCKQYTYNWFQLIDFRRKINIVLINVFKGNIIFYDTAEYMVKIYCFNTETHTFSYFMSLITAPSAVVSFIHKDQLYVLTHDGSLRNITADVDPPTLHSDADMEGGSSQQMFVSIGDTNACEKIDSGNRKTSDALHNPVSAHAPQKLWDGSLELCGAVVYTDKLVIFADLNYYKAPIVTDKSVLQVLGLSEINFIHLPASNKCYPLVVPSKILIQKA